MHIIVNDGRILNSIELKLFRLYASLKPLLIYYNNGLAICHGFLDSTHIKVDNVAAGGKMLANKTYFIFRMHSMNNGS